ncbi:hypothetical protein ABU113_14380 [Sphingosinicellaceae bacterium M-36]
MNKAVAFCCSALVGMTVASLTPAQAQTAATPAARMDIAGVRIGMTEAQTRAALTAFDPGMRIIRVTSRYNYAAGEGRPENLSTPEFLDRLEVQPARGGFELFIVHFATPPAEPRVIAIERPNLAHTQNPPTQQQFRASLLAKYGQPSFAEAHQLVWEEAGKPRCAFTRRGNRPHAGDELRRNRVVPTFQNEQRYQSLGLTLARDPAACGQLLIYSYDIWSGPVRTARASLVDLGAVWSAEVRSSQWVNGLKAEAARKADARAQPPRL